MPLQADFKIMLISFFIFSTGILYKVQGPRTATTTKMQKGRFFFVRKKEENAYRREVFIVLNATFYNSALLI